MGVFVVESVIDEMCNKLGFDLVEVCLKNVVWDGMKFFYGLMWDVIG